MTSLNESVEQQVNESIKQHESKTKEKIMKLRQHPFYIIHEKYVENIINNINNYYLDLFKFTPSASVLEICTFTNVLNCPSDKDTFYYDNCHLFITGSDGPAIAIRINEDHDGVYNLEFIRTYITWLLPKDRFEMDSNELLEKIKTYLIPVISIDMQERICNDLGNLEESTEGMLTVIENCIKTSADGWGEFSLYGHVTAEELRLSK